MCGDIRIRRKNRAYIHAVSWILRTNSIHSVGLRHFLASIAKKGPLAPLWISKVSHSPLADSGSRCAQRTEIAIAAPQTEEMK